MLLRSKEHARVKAPNTARNGFGFAAAAYYVRVLRLLEGHCSHLAAAALIDPKALLVADIPAKD
jgi:hypothetical protein